MIKIAFFDVNGTLLRLGHKELSSPVFAQGSNGGVGGGFSSRDGGSLGSHTDPIRIPRRGRTQINFQGSRRSRGDGACQ